MYQLDYINIPQKEEYEKIINKIVQACFKEEKLETTKLYISIILTDSKYIQEINKKYRNIDKPTDVLSFPMFEKNEIPQENEMLHEEILGDIVISIEKVEEQAKEYEHSFEREFSYMLVHGFYHLMGYDHIKEDDKVEMREKEEKILKSLNIMN